MNDTKEFTPVPPHIEEEASKLKEKAAKEFDERRGSAIQRLRQRATEKPKIVPERLAASVKKFQIKTHPQG